VGKLEPPITAPKAGALPLGYTPCVSIMSGPTEATSDPPGRCSLAKALRFSEAIHQRISDSHVRHNRSHLDANAQRSIKTH